MDICHLGWLQTHKGTSYFLFRFIFVKNYPDLDFAVFFVVDFVVLCRVVSYRVVLHSRPSSLVSCLLFLSFFLSLSLCEHVTQYRLLKLC